MGPLKSLSLVLLLSGLAVGQATVIGGTASNWAPPYGVYAAPFVPLVVTPSVSLETVSPSAAGASNATFGNVAGARNATLDIVTPPPVGVYTVPVWYGPKPGEHHGVAMEMRHEHEIEMEMHGGMHERGMMHEEHERHLEVGIAHFQSSRGVASLMASAGPAKKAGRTYTNADIDRFNQGTGSVKWDGKSEKLN
jgi:hypothetical protein